MTPIMSARWIWACCRSSQQAAKAAKASLTYSASLAYKTDFGLMPYVTNAKSSRRRDWPGQPGSDLALANDDWLSIVFPERGRASKFSFLDQHLVGSLAWYRQERTQLQQAGGVTSVMGTRSKGGEAEIRYVMDQNFSFTLAGSLQHTIVKGPDQSFAYIPARDAGVSPSNGFGGAYVVYNFSSLPGKSGQLRRHADPACGDQSLSHLHQRRSGLGRDLRRHLCFANRADRARSDHLSLLCPVNLSGFVRLGVWEADVQCRQSRQCALLHARRRHLRQSGGVAGHRPHLAHHYQAGILTR